MIGRTIGKYRVVEQVGRGGMGTVYKAVDETLDRTVAIKVLNGDLLDQDSVERFRREAVTLARLSHPRIGAIHELTRDGHDLLMVMEFISGETFEKLIERSGPLDIPEAVRLCTQVLDGLQYAHRAGVIHRDLKPANVIVMPTGDVKIMDFGIARVQGSEHLTSVGFMVGTPAYMSPEQVRGEEVDPRMDLYSLAVVLYRLLTHRLPFQGDTAIAMIHSQLSNPPTPPRQFRADLPEWIVATLTRGLAKVPADRFQTAAEFRAALEHGMTGKMAVAEILGASHAETMAPTRTPQPMAVPPPPEGTATAADPIARTPRSPTTSSMRLPSAMRGSPPGGTAIGPAPSAVQPRPPAPAPAPEPTVTLRAPHLATAGVLITVLVVGIGVLAFVAFRRLNEPSPTPNTEAAARSAAAVTTTDTPPVATPPPPSATTPPPATPTPTTDTPAGASPAPGATAASPARGGAGTGRVGASPSAPTAPRGRAAAPTETPAPPIVATPAPAAPTVPAAANAPAEHFNDLRVLTVDGARGREIEALLALEPGTLVLRERNGSMLRTLPYQNVKAVTYVRSRRPRGQDIPGTAPVPQNIGGSGFLGGARHWLTLQTESEFLTLRLEDRNVIAVMRGVEARTGVTVVRARD